MKGLNAEDPGKYQIAPLCSLAGVKKQSYYQAIKRGPSKLELAANEVVAMTLEVRKEDPRIGATKLWHMYQKTLGKDWPVGRQSFNTILRKNNLLLKRRKKSVKTTDSAHSIPTYPNLVKPLRIERPNQVWVSDITYVYLHTGDERSRFCFITFIMDAYTHQVIGWKVGDSLATEHTIQALEMAIDSAEAQGVDLTKVIHHSDRGVQYVSRKYTNLLVSKGMAISMTECGNPKENAQAERLNGIFKNELFFGKKFTCVEEVVEAMVEKVDFYNNQRPHMSNGMLTPNEAARCTGRLQKEWRSRRDDALDRICPLKIPLLTCDSALWTGKRENEKQSRTKTLLLAYDKEIAA